MYKGELQPLDPSVYVCVFVCVCVIYNPNKIAQIFHSTKTPHAENVFYSGARQSTSSIPLCQNSSGCTTAPKNPPPSA